MSNVLGPTVLRLPTPTSVRLLTQFDFQPFLADVQLSRGRTWLPVGSSCCARERPRSNGRVAHAGMLGSGSAHTDCTRPSCHFTNLYTYHKPVHLSHTCTLSHTWTFMHACMLHNTCPRQMSVVTAATQHQRHGPTSCQHLRVAWVVVRLPPLLRMHLSPVLYHTIKGAVFDANYYSLLVPR